MAATKEQILAYFDSLTSKSNRRVLIGQQNCARRLEIQSCYDEYFLGLETLTGYQPAVIGFQWRRTSPSFTAADITLMTNLAIDHWEAGGLVMVTASFANPWTGGGTNDTNRPLWGLEELVDSGESVYADWHDLLDQYATELQVFADAGVVIIFRIFREVLGGWYWWGPVPDAGNEWTLDQSRYTDSFKAAFQDVHDYLGNTHGLDDHLIFAYTTCHRDIGRNLAAAFPGADYADLVGCTVYDDNFDIGSTGYSELQSCGVPIIIPEHGPEYDPMSGTYDCMNSIDAVRDTYDDVVMIQYWATWTENTAAIVDNDGAADLMTDPWIIPLGLVEIQETTPPAETIAVYKDDSALRGLWMMEEASGTRYDQTLYLNHLTDNNTVTQSADAQQGTYSADFESGTNEYLEITDGNQEGLDLSTAFTICMWIKPESVAANAFLAGKYVTSGNLRAYMLWLVLSGGSLYPRLNVSSDGSSYSAVQADTAVSAGSWVHLAAVYDGTELTIYRNGVSDCSPTAFSSSVYNSSSAFRLGRHPEDVWPYDGLMDEVAVFRRALTAAQILDIYTNGIQNPPVYDDDVNLRGLWRMEEESGTRYDDSPNDSNDLTDNNSVGYSSDAQEGDNSADFEDTSSQYLSIADASQTGLDLSDQFTILMWVKPESLTDVGRHALVSKFDIDGGDRAYQVSLLLDTGSYYHRVSVSADGAAATHLQASTATTAGSWVHLAAVYDGNELRLYRDGELDCTPVTSFTSLLNNSDAAFEVGRGTNDEYYYDGLIDELAVFDRALVQGEIEYIVANGIVAEEEEEPPTPPAPPPLPPGTGTQVLEAQYKLRFLDTDGNLVAEVTDFLGLSYVKQVNAAGLCRFVLAGDHHAIDELGHRYIVEVWRRVVNAEIDWYRDFQGLFLDQQRYQTDAAYFEGAAPGVLWLLGTRHVLWYANTTNRSKFTSQPAETVMKYLVDYNCGANATTGNGRIRAGAITGITVAATASGGNTISWGCSWKNVLDELQELARVAGGDFDLEEQTAANWEFDFYSGQRGTDLTETLTFSLAWGNMANPRYRYNRIQEATVVLAAGRGREDTRMTQVVTGEDYAATNDVELFVDANNRESAAALVSAANEKLDTFRAREELSFDVLQTPASLYGKHYCIDGVMGDLVTARYDELTLTQKISRVAVALQADGGERIDVTTETV